MGKKYTWYTKIIKSLSVWLTRQFHGQSYRVPWENRQTTDNL